MNRTSGRLGDSLTHSVLTCEVSEVSFLRDCSVGGDGRRTHRHTHTHTCTDAWSVKPSHREYVDHLLLG